MKGFCFVAGTEIATPEGGKAIETFKAGDAVISLDAVNDVIEMHDMGEHETYMLSTEDCTVPTTASEKVLTPEGLKVVESLVIGEPIMTVHGYQPVTQCEPTGKVEQVYELQCTGDNLFYANGIMAEGINEDELQAIKGNSNEDADNKGTKKTSTKGSKKNTEKVEE